MKRLNDAHKRNRRRKRKGGKDSGKGDFWAATMKWPGGFLSTRGVIRFQPPVDNDFGAAWAFLFARGNEVPVTPFTDQLDSRRDTGQALRDCIEEAAQDE